jgi:hypothetical protein
MTPIEKWAGIETFIILTPEFDLESLPVGLTCMKDSGTVRLPRGAS